MKSNGALEDWDEILLAGYRERLKQTDPETGLPTRQKRDRGARCQNLFAMMKDRLEAYQGHFVKTGPYRGTFQFARYLKLGDQITNKTTGDVYTIKERHHDEDGVFSGEVTLSGGTDPAETDTLRLDAENLVVFEHAHKYSEVSSSEFDSASDRTDKPAPLNDTIEYSRVRYEPGTVGKRPFDREKQAVPSVRESNLDDDVDPGLGYRVSGQWYDNLVQFDLYARTNERLDGSLSPTGVGDQGLLAWFQNFMELYKWVFLWNGVNKILEWQGREDEVVRRYKNEFAKRSLLYYVRTERICVARHRRIAQLDVFATVGAPEECTAQSGVPVPTGQIDATLSDFGLYSELGG